jgi:hypothetical protein
MVEVLVFLIVVQFPLTIYGYWMIWQLFGDRVMKNYKAKRDKNHG